MRTILSSILVVLAATARADVTGTISGDVLAPSGVPIKGAQVTVLSEGHPPITALSTESGRFEFSDIDFGDHMIEVEAPTYGKQRLEVHVTSGAATKVSIRFPEQTEDVLIHSTKILSHDTSSMSSYEISDDEIERLPLGDDTSLTDLLARTIPGAVQGPFGQLFIRSFDTSVQYQIDGVTLPTSISNMFGDAFKPRNIDHMEVITGGLPAEYGQRVAAVVNILTRSGYEHPGGTVDLNYGSYNSTSPEMFYGGSNSSGKLHYFLSVNYRRTDRGLDTPQPVSLGDQTQGGREAVHDHSNGHNEFLRMDWDISSADKLAFVLTNSQLFLEIPNYPAWFSPTDPLFDPNHTDQFQNKGGFLYAPATTDDWQREYNIYSQATWRHAYADGASLRLSTYYKYSSLLFHNDPANDLASFTLIPGSKPSSFYENRHVNTAGMKMDYVQRLSENHLLKTGVEGSFSKAEGVLSLIAVSRTSNTLLSTTDGNPATGVAEGIYAQDEYSISKAFILNAGVRVDATQFTFADASPNDWLPQPRVGLTWLKDDVTKYHIFYGRLFQPSPLENVRTAYAAVGQGTLAPYDIKPEKDHYFEAGFERQLGGQVLKISGYYVMAEDMLDNVQLLNTSINQPINFSEGTTVGGEFSLRGSITPEWSELLNYSYSYSQGDGQSGGFFLGNFDSGGGGEKENYTDQTQLHTVSGALTYSKSGFWWTTQMLFGSGFYTGPDNGVKLPSHFTVDTSVGYQFKGSGWTDGFKLSGDAMNLTNNVYPITITNRFNGSHYAAGRQFFVRLSKDF